MDTTLLVVFREVARLGSFTAAATTLGYTQSAVSRQISTLEGELGVGLFDRLPRGVALTEEGRSLLPHAETLLERLDAARSDLRSLRDLESGRLRIGAFATADAALVPWAMASFRREHPKVVVTLAERLTPDLVTLLMTGELDIAVVSSYSGDDLGELELEHLLDDAMYVALPPGHPLASRGEVAFADLVEESWIAGDTRAERTLIGSAFEPRIEMVAREWIAKQGLVAAGLGVTMIPSLAVAAARPDLAVVVLRDANAPVRSVYVATAPHRTRSPAAVAFAELLHQSAARLRDSLP